MFERGVVWVLAAIIAVGVIVALFLWVDDEPQSSECIWVSDTYCMDNEEIERLKSRLEVDN